MKDKILINCEVTKMEQVNMKRCFRCGAFEPQNQPFCGNCGIQMTSQQPVYRVQPPPIQQPIVNQPPNNVQPPNYPPQMANNYGQSASNQPRQAGFIQPPPNNNNQFNYGYQPNQFQPPNNYQNNMPPNAAPSRITAGRLIVSILLLFIGLISILTGVAAILGGHHR